MADERVLEDRRSDLDGRDRIERIADGYESFVRAVTWYLRAFVALAFVGAAVFTYLLYANGQRTDDVKTLARGIQAERTRTIRAACRETNQRHDDTLHVLGVALAAADPPNRSELAVVIVRAINSLAPKQDCEALVRGSVSGGG